ncbi:unnamed protein product [Prorocentrum cordatum]|nr:unnamed protein product [Polarella glacialis]
MAGAQWDAFGPTWVALRCCVALGLRSAAAALAEDARARARGELVLGAGELRRQLGARSPPCDLPREDARVLSEREFRQRYV